jgi:ribosomal protein L30/L7E
MIDGLFRDQAEADRFAMNQMIEKQMRADYLVKLPYISKDTAVENIMRLKQIHGGEIVTTNTEALELVREVERYIEYSRSTKVRCSIDM